MHAMADAILERMEHLRKKTEKRQRSAAASAANTTDGGMTTRSVDADKDTLATDAHSHSEAEITGSQPAQFSGTRKRSLGRWRQHLLAVRSISR